MKIFGRCIILVCTVYKRLHTKKSFNSLSKFFPMPMSKSYIVHYTYTNTITIYYYFTIIYYTLLAF